MAGKAQRTIRIKWVRSTIGFTRRQRAMVRSLGLRRLNQVVERPDSPQVRGVMANIPHLVEIVEGTAAALWTSIPEYTVRPPEGQPTPVPLAISKATTKGPAKEEVEVTIAEPVTQKAAKSSVEATSKAAKAAKSQKRARQSAPRTKSAKASAAKKPTQAKAGSAKKAKPSKKEK